MVNFIIGRAGSGKSHRLCQMIENEIQNTTRPVVLIVPEQQTVVWETKMAASLPVSANLRLEITNFTRLSNSVFREGGGLTDTVIDEGSRSLLVWRAMMSVYEHLTVYNKGHEDRSIPHLINAIDELKASGISPASAEEALSKLRSNAEEETRAGDLSSRLSDAVLVYAAYEQMLHEDHIDRGDLLASLAKALTECEYFRGKAVFIDSFFSLTKPEERILERIISQAEDVTVTFACPPTNESDEIQFGEIREFMKKTAGIAAKCGKEITKIPLTENRRHSATPELNLIEKHLFNYTSSLPTAEAEENAPADSVKIVKCTDKFDEAEAAAAIIEKLLREGYRNSDIAVIAGDITSREGIIDTVLRRHGIRCFMSEAGSISSSPAVRLILSALGVAIGGWQRKNVLRLLKTGMTPAGRRLSPEEDDSYKFEGDVFETYTGTWNIHGRRMYTSDDWSMNPDGYSFNISDSGTVTLRLANAAKNKIIPPLDRFLSVFDGGVAPVREICTRLVYFAEEYGVCDALEEIAESYRRIGMPADGEKIRASWDAVCDICDKMVKMLGDTNLDAARFSSLFARVAASMDVGTIPTGIDEVVLGSGSGIRFDKVKCVIILGALSGEFPAAIRGGGSFFDDRDKMALESVGLELSSLDTDMQTAREYFMFYRSVASPTEKLFILAPIGGGEELSDGALRIQKILSGLGKDCTVAFASLPLSEVLFSTAGAEYQLSRRHDATELALLKSLTEEGRLSSPVPLTAKYDVITSKGISQDKMYLSQSQIDMFVKCPFNYSCQHLMNLRSEPKAEINYADIGSFIHRVIEKFFTETPAAQIQGGLSADEINSISDRIIAEYLDELVEKSGKARDGRINYLFVRLKRYVPIFIESILRELKQGKFTPIAHELPIKSNSPGAVSPIVFTTEDGTEITINGVIDRVDLYEEDGKKYIRVVDYKTGSKTFSLAKIAKGLDVQLTVYLFSLWKLGLSSLGISGDVVPAGAVYFSACPTANASLKMLSSEEAVEFTIDKIQRSGIYLSDENILRAMDEGLSGKYVAIKNKDGEIKSSTASTALMSLEELGDLYNHIEDVIKNVATEMKRGKAEANPIREDKDYPCKYCRNKFICRSAKNEKEE